MNVPATAAVVLVFPGAERRLFDPEVARLTDSVEELLGAAPVYVTHACADGRSPTIGDAAAAARFVGCSTTLLVHGGWLDAGLEVPGAHVVRCEGWTAGEVARAVRERMALGRAAARRGEGAA